MWGPILNINRRYVLWLQSWTRAVDSVRIYDTRFGEILQLAIKDAPGHLRTVTLTEVIAEDNTEQVESLLMQELAGGAVHLVVDLSQVDHISSSGLKMLVSVWKRAHELKGTVVLAGLQPPIREVFTLIGFDLVFTIFDSVADAQEQV